MRSLAVLAAAALLAGCAPPLRLETMAERATPTERVFLRGLELSLAEELARDCPDVTLAPAAVAAWQEAALAAYAAELERAPWAVPERFSDELAPLQDRAPEIVTAWRRERGLSAPPHEAERACAVIEQERADGSLIGRVLG